MKKILYPGKPWDLMAWGFSWDGGKMPMSVKSSVQLEQEAAQIMAMGAVSIITWKKPAKIILQPEGRKLDIDFQNGVSKVVVPELMIYSILEVIP
jgi:hypothetical protein